MHLSVCAPYSYHFLLFLSFSPQGPTSSGKTSMVEYLARRTNHKFVRISNHEHTDLQVSRAFIFRWTTSVVGCPGPTTSLSNVPRWHCHPLQGRPF